MLACGSVLLLLVVSVNRPPDEGKNHVYACTGSRLHSGVASMNTQSRVPISAHQAKWSLPVSGFSQRLGPRAETGLIRRIEEWRAASF